MAIVCTVRHVLIIVYQFHSLFFMSIFMIPVQLNPDLKYFTFIIFSVPYVGDSDQTLATYLPEIFEKQKNPRIKFFKFFVMKN